MKNNSMIMHQILALVCVSTTHRYTNGGKLFVHDNSHLNQGVIIAANQVLITALTSLILHNVASLSGACTGPGWGV